ncbi:hypothetical protein ACH5RR_011204 [Cinchona calisaya]|uniref:Uncharacterized protein n=1 Tax=Cinchona calisaya TaxID=153742 RepID=A0ABD3AA04_9GENT
MARKRKASDQCAEEKNSSGDEGNVAWDEMVKEAAAAAALGALPSKITNLLLSRIKARNNALAAVSGSPSVLPMDHQKLQKQTDDQYHPDEEASDFPDAQFTDFLNDLDDYTPPEQNGMMINTTNNSSDFMSSSSESCSTQNDQYEVFREPGLDFKYWGEMVHSSNVSVEEEETEEDVEEENNNVNPGIMDFHFIDEIGSCYNYSPLEIAGGIAEPMEVYGDDPSMLSEAMKRMNYERKFSASLYAFNGITECLKLKLKSGSVLQQERSEQLARLRNVCNRNNFQDHQEKGKIKEDNNVAATEKKQEEETTTSAEEGASSSNCDGESSLWSSIDLPPICYVS